MTQVSLGLLLGRHRAHIANIEAGATRVFVDDAVCLAAALGVSVAALTDGPLPLVRRKRQTNTPPVHS